MQLVQLRQHAPAFDQAGADVLAISSDDGAESARLVADLGGLPFPLLADPERRAIWAYGVFHEHEPKGRAIARPAVFVLDAAGVVRYRHVGTAATDRPSPETILAAVRALKRPAAGTATSPQSPPG